MHIYYTQYSKSRGESNFVLEWKNYRKSMIKNMIERSLLPWSFSDHRKHSMNTYMYIERELKDIE